MRRIDTIIGVLIAVILLFPALSPGSEIERYKLKNGMTVILLADHSTPAVSMNIWVNVGAFTESPGESGMSHFVEHMVFEGTDELAPGEGPAVIEAAGGNFNAYTDLDNTVLVATVPSRFLETMIRVVSDTALGAAFPKDEVERERQVILEEIRMDADDPQSRLSNLFFEKSFGDHPYGKPVIGTSEKVGSYTRDDLFAYYRTYWRPENMAIVLVGDFDPSAARPMIQRYAGGAPKGGAPELPDVSYPVDRGPSVAGIDASVHTAYLLIGFNIPPITDRDLYPLDVASVILGDGKDSRLYRALVGEGLAYSVDVYSYTPRRAGTFFVSATLDPANVTAAVKTVIGEIARLVSQPVSDEELEKARTGFTADFVFDKETFAGRARSLGFYETALKDVDFEDKYLARIGAVTAADIVRAAKKYFVPENMTVTYLVPTQDKGVSSDTEIGSTAVAAFRTPAGSKPEVPALVAGPMGYKAVLANGIRVVIKENHSLPVVAVTVAFSGGVRNETNKDSGITNLIGHMLTRGTASLTADAIAERTDRIAADIRGFSGRDSFGMKAEFLTRYQDEGWRLLSDMIVNPSFDSDELSQAKEIAAAAIDQKKDSLPQRTIDLFKKTLYRNHPYALPLIGTRESIKRLTREDLTAYWSAHAVPSEMVVSVVGDVKPDEVLRRVADLFGDLKGGEGTPPAPNRIEPPAKALRVTESVKDKEQAHIFFGFLGADYLSDDYYALDVLTAVLSGMGGRMFCELREKRGLCYAVDAINYGGVDRGFFGVYLATAPKNLSEAVGGIETELARVRGEGVTPEELERAKNYLIGNYELSLQKNIDTALIMATDELYGLGYDFSLTYADKINAVTDRDIRRAAETYLRTDRSVLAIVMPSL
jgi:zinc protease